LWIAASGLYAVTLAAFTVSSWPVVDEIPHHPSFTYRMPQAAQAVVGRAGPKTLKELEQELVAADKRSDVSEARRLANEILARRKEPWGAAPLVLEMPNGHKFEVAADTKSPDVDLVGQEYVNVLKAEQKNRQQQSVLHAFLFWLGPVLAAGLLGVTARWVYAGFIAGRN
jgi:hypothetical protein